MFWSYLLTAIGVIGLLLVTRKRRLGWAVGIFAQVLWVTYAIVTDQYGFIISALVYATVNYIGFRNYKEPSMNDNAYRYPIFDEQNIVRCADIHEGIRCESFEYHAGFHYGEGRLWG